MCVVYALSHVGLWHKKVSIQRNVVFWKHPKRTHDLIQTLIGTVQSECTFSNFTSLIGLFDREVNESVHHYLLGGSDSDSSSCWSCLHKLQRLGTIYTYKYILIKLYYNFFNSVYRNIYLCRLFIQ